MAPGATRRQFPRKLSRWKYLSNLPKRVRPPRETVELELDITGLDTGSLADQLVYLKAAWILTLQCFQPREVIQLIFEADALAVHTVRVDPQWEVRTLLEQIEATNLSENHDAQSYRPHSAQASSRNACTASLRYVGGLEKASNWPIENGASKSKVFSTGGTHILHITNSKTSLSQIYASPEPTTKCGLV